MKWTYTATANLLMTITITNERAAGVQSSTPQNGSTLVSRTLTDSVSSLAQQIPWDPVDVQEGPYVAVAFDTNRTAGIFVTSSQFFVLNGQDTSCLMSNGTSSPSEIASTTGATTSPSQSTVPDDSPSETQPKTLSSGALAGTIVGVIVGVVLLLVAFSFPHIWRHSLPSTSRSRRAGGPYLLF